MGSHEESIPRGGREQGGEPDATGSHGERLEAGAGTPRETETRVHIKGSRKYKERVGKSDLLI